MISVSEELKNAFNTGNQKDLTLYFSDNTSLTNENIVAESMSLEQILCDEEQIAFGLCNSASFKITILNSNKSRVGQTVTPVISIRGTEYSMQLGVFKIVEDKVTDDRLHRNITAYDSLYDIVNTDYASWYTSLTFPMTLKQFRDSFFTHIGLTQVSASLINDSMTVEKTVDADVFSGSDIIRAICELNAVFGCIDNEGNFKYIPFVHEGGLYPEEDLFPADDLYPNDGFDVIVSGSPYSYVSGSFVYEDYVVQRITGLAIVEDESDTSELYGTDENLYMITGNYLLFGKNATDLRTVAENFLGFVGRFQYKPARIRMRAMPWVELGDIIGVVGKKGNAVFPILKRTMSGITALYDDYEAQGKEYYSFSANTVSSMVEKLKSKTMRIVANVDEISTELVEYETQTDGTLESHSSRIQQNADNITSEVARATGSENSLSSRIIQTAESIESEVRRATGAEGDLSSLIQQNANQILLRVEKNGVISAINQSAEQVQISASKINLQGYVTVTDLSGSGTTTINGSNIKTGVITSNNGSMTIDLDNNTITAEKLIVTATNFRLSSSGVLTCSGATINEGKLNLSYSANYSCPGASSGTTFDVEATQRVRIENGKLYFDLRTDKINGTTYGGSFENTLQIYSIPFEYQDDVAQPYARYRAYISTSSHQLEELRITPWVRANGGLSASNVYVDNIYLNGSTISRPQTRGSNTGFMYLDSGEYSYHTTQSGYIGRIQIGWNDDPHFVFRPYADAVTDKYYLGTASRRWGRVYSAQYYGDSTAIITSDETVKTDINSLDLQKSSDFIYSLKPCEYKMVNGTSDRFHHGFIAQEVKESLGNNDWGVYIDQSLEEDSESNLKGLRYAEFIADMVATIQLQNKRIKELEEKVNG